VNYGTISEDGVLALHALFRKSVPMAEKSLIIIFQYPLRVEPNYSAERLSAA
jgi:hypothetical protein